MWWSRPVRRPRYPRARVAAAVLALAVLAGCGFQPLYATGKDGETATEDGLAATRIQPMKGRTGQQLHNLLRDRLNPGGQSIAPAYELEIQLSKSITQLGIRKDETATRANLTMTASFSLRDAQSKNTLLNSKAISVNSYNILDALYATTVAENNAVERGLRELADDIRLRLAIYFADPRTAKNP